MGAKGEAPARKFEAKVAEAACFLQKRDDADWKKTTAAEKWTVAMPTWRKPAPCSRECLQ